MSLTQTHIPVMEAEVLNFIKESKISADFLIDATFGRGGHSLSCLKQFSNLKILACDKDIEAIKYGELHFKSFVTDQRLFFSHTDFKNIDKKEFCLFSKIQCSHILVDLGVSSPQLDQAERGFSFYKDGPLDMRMDKRQDFIAADIVNTYSQDQLIALFQNKGEVYKPYRVVRAIIEDRKHKTFSKTLDLAGLIERVDSWQKKSFHPATKYFMALRLEVNSELDDLKEALEKFINYLQPGGRLIVLSFHSLEDRIVKQLFKSCTDKGNILTKKIIKASEEEKKENPRSRSAKLRVFEKAL